MAQPDAFDDALAALAQAFADLGFVVNTMMTLRQQANRLRPMLATELRELKETIDETLELL
jgi:hypothetical protein